ncbi:pectinesterase/pectinesterase inhibitor PPE8B isoform X2 [Hevea brasiliensis]|uniref:pectinesterase/pectinesterase inhibitor PPE8B isoform X2 n=1 Tax=Hevea brasiliensis TaxID=3981 RepID=UPI0025D5AB51|nr:pectinesterase/pectinesterase inhibitor PPE8B isoform X2 [Hevea brasiliensis]
MSRFSLPSLLLSLFVVLILVSTPCAASSRTRSEYLRNEFLKVPISEFVGSLKTAIDIIQDVTSTISNFGNFFGDFRLSNAITDCLDLLDFSADELSWTMSASQNPKGKNNSTGDLNSDLRTWLSAALVNQDTCIDGFEGTSSILKSLAAGGLNQITSLVQELLSKVDSKRNSKTNGVAFTGSKSAKNDKFPSWIKHEDRKLLVINGVTPDAIVAADGTGNFTKIMDAVSAAPDYSMRRYVIYIKNGLYTEYVEIKKKKWNLMMVGDGMGATVISGNRNFIDGWTTFRSATFGAAKHQAVALRSDSDLSVFFRCEVRGHQDTLYTHTMRQFYRECRISGTVDFIFGDATAVFQDCQILAKKGLPSQKNTITAHGRKDPNQPTGYSIQFCNITADIDLLPYANSTYTYLGRPWKNFSRTVFMQSYISNAIRPEGWLEWNGDQYLDTLYYGEYSNYGPGSGLTNRVRWPGYHIFNTSYQANNFTVAQFIEGNLWLPSTGVRYTAGLDV